MSNAFIVPLPRFPCFDSIENRFDLTEDGAIAFSTNIVYEPKSCDLRNTIVFYKYYQFNAEPTAKMMGENNCPSVSPMSFQTDFVSVNVTDALETSFPTMDKNSSSTIETEQTDNTSETSKK